ncbi:MAG TPA: DUF1015 domain-containing protein [Gaiellaceae bacterium]
MAVVKPFRALRYAEPGQGVVAPPYDVISPEQRAEYLARDPRNVVHLTLPDSEEEAARTLEQWRRDGVLVEDEEPAVWALEQEFTGPDGVRRKRAGVVASLEVEPYEAGVVLPHERTHAGPKEGRLRLLRATRTQLEPIFVLHEGAPLLQGEGAPTLEAEEGGVATRLWRVDDPGEIERVQAALREPRLLIADGHHRYETALAFREEDGADSMMVVLVGQDQDGLVIFPTHRLFERKPEQPLHGFEDWAPSVEEGLQRLEQLPRDHPAALFYQEGRAALVQRREPGVLDVVFVDRLGHEGISYTPNVEEAVRAVDSGAAVLAVLLRAPRIDEVRAVAERGEVMPQKSTYFYPKLLSGLLFHPV